MNEKLDKVKAEVVELHSKIDTLTTDLASLKVDVKELVDVFKGAKGVLTTIKWSATVGAGLTAMIAYVKHLKY